MLKRYIENQMSQEPHHRRVHAMRFATIITALVFVGWLTTFGMELGGGEVATDENDIFAQTAAAINGFSLPSGDVQVSQEDYTGL